MFSGPILPVTAGVRLIQLRTQGSTVIAVMMTTPYAARCPQCHQLSRHMHSRYVRQLADLPWGRAVTRIELHTRRFFCHTPGCRQDVFTERIPGLAAPYGRRTYALAETLHRLALAAGAKVVRAWLGCCE
jgi:transposase